MRTSGEGAWVGSTLPRLASAKASAKASPDRLAAAKEARNEGCNELVRLMGSVDIGGSNYVVILGFLSVLSLWQLKGVSRAFRRWSTLQLSSLPWIVSLGGTVEDRSVAPPVEEAVASAVTLDLSTMRWSGAGCMPPLPDPRTDHSMRRQWLRGATMQPLYRCRTARCSWPAA